MQTAVTVPPGAKQLFRLYPFGLGKHGDAETIGDILPQRGLFSFRLPKGDESLLQKSAPTAPGSPGHIQATQSVSAGMLHMPSGEKALVDPASPQLVQHTASGPAEVLVQQILHLLSHAVCVQLHRKFQSVQQSCLPGALLWFLS